MRRAVVLVAALAAAAALAGLGLAATVGLPLFYEKGPINVFGYVTSVTQKGREYRLRFDPAFFLTGLTANVAAVEDKQIKPGEGVANDYYVRNPEHSLLTFRLPTDTHVTVLANLGTTKISVAYLAKALRTSKPCGRMQLRPPCRLGFWLRYSGDTAQALDQQYQP
jgi:hypothetical protein